MSSEKAVTLSVPVLETQKDWEVWSDKIRNQLATHGFSAMIKTKDPVNPEGELHYDPADWTKYVREFRDKQERALGVIKDKCCYNAKDLIKECTTPLDALEILEKNYSLSGDGEFKTLIEEWNQLTIQSEGVNAYGSEVRRLWNRFTQIHSKVTQDECFAVMKFITGLSSEFDMWQTTFMQTHNILPKTTGGVTVQVTLADAIADAERFHHIQKASSESHMFAGRRPKAQPHQPREKCKHCKRPHRGECFSLNPSKAPEWWKERESKKRKVSDDDETTFFSSETKKKTVQHVAISDDSAFNVASRSGETMTFHKGRSLFDTWIIDSGASSHLIGRRDVFTSFKEIHGHTSRGIGGNSVNPIGIGTIQIPARVDGKLHKLNITNVKYSPNAGVNLLSLDQIWSQFDQVIPSTTGLSFVKGNKAFRTQFEEGLLILDTMPTPQDDLCMAAYEVEDGWASLWHERLGHLGEQNVRRLKKMVDGMDAHTLDGQCICEACVMGRFHAKPHRGHIKRGKQKLDLLHMDSKYGPKETRGYDGSRFWLTIVDDSTTNTDCLVYKHVRDVVDLVRHYLDHHETPVFKCRRIRLDQGSEFITNDFKNLCYDRGIELEFTSTEQSQSNGVAEVVNKIILEKLEPTLYAGKLELKWWPAVVEAMAYLRNRCPNSRLDITAHEAWTGERPDISNIRKIGSKAYVLKKEPKDKRPGYVHRADIGKLLGFKGNKQYLVICPDRKSVV